MSADNYVKVRKFGPKDFRWGMWFMSEDDPDFSDDKFDHGPFKTPIEARDNVQKEYATIEYGVEFEDNCFVYLEDEQAFQLEDLNYSKLSSILEKALDQASQGKGKERHASGEPFENQIICEVTRRLSSNPAAGALFQSVKKIYESGRLLSLYGKEEAVKELLGAINYIAAAIIVIEEGE